MLNCDRVSDNGITTLRLEGQINEESNPKFVFKDLSGRVQINLRGIDYIDSSGLRDWIKAISSVPAEVELEFHEVSVRFVYQLNMSLNARGRARVVSFMAPYYCGSCEKQRDTLLVSEAYPKHLGRPEAISVPGQACSECAGNLLFDELPEEYFLFLKMQLLGH